MVANVNDEDRKNTILACQKKTTNQVRCKVNSISLLKCIPSIVGVLHFVVYSIHNIHTHLMTLRDEMVFVVDNVYSNVWNRAHCECISMTGAVLVGKKPMC